MQLIPLRYLVDRVRHPKSRAEVLRELRAILAEQAEWSRASHEERHLALELAALREAMHKGLGEVESCGRCAEGHPLPNGRWQGGHCCGTETHKLFSRAELAALKLSGTTPAKLVGPHSDHAGCAFRGPEGCSLDVADRPNLCVRFICRELSGELRDRGDRPKLRALSKQIEETFICFVAARRARLEDEMLEDLAAE
jgi:hypothetical protein